MTPRETELRAEVARRVEKETAVQAAGGAFTSPALSVYAETLKPPHVPEIGHNGQTVKGNQKMTDTPKRPARVIVAGHGQHFTNTRQKPVKPMPRLSPPKPPTDSANWQATPDGKKELAND